MACNKSEHGAQRVTSVVTATLRVRRMAAIETRGFGDDDNALRRLEAFSGIGFWTLRYLKLGYAKTINADLAERLRQAYLAYVGDKAGDLRSELTAEREEATEADADLETLLAEIQELAAKVEKARLKLRARG